MSKIISETFYGSHEPQWLVESPKEPLPHFDCRGCVRQIRSSSGFRDVARSYAHTTPGRDYGRPSMVNADRHAYVYNGAPATHRTVIDRPGFTGFSTATVGNIPIVEFMVPLCCGKCEEKVTEELENVEGVYKVVCDHHNQRVTVSSTVDPERLLKRVKRIKRNAHFWSGTCSRYGQLEIGPHASPRSPYTHHAKRRAGDYYAGAENYHGLASAFRPSMDASRGYIAGPPLYMESSLDYGRPSPSYGPAYEYY